jgi:signal transduction histidine kinase
MNLKSIRWKLPLTYAGIALITALVLGGTLLIIVRRYYQDQELDYLRNNAIAISSAVGPFLNKDQSASVPTDLKSHLSLLAFLSQTRIRLLDPKGSEIGAFSFIGAQDPQAVLSAISLPAPSGGSNATGPQVNYFTSPVEPPGTSAAPASGEMGVLGIQIFQPAQGMAGGATGGQAVTIQVVPMPDAAAQPGANVTFQSMIPAEGTMYGFDLQGNAAVPAARSDQVFRQNIKAADGALLGSVELSDGPAYGMDIVNKVASGWLISSLVGMLIAVLAGWWISQRINAPILVLTHSTQRMADGDLSTRAALQGQDEFGELANSFNTMAERVEETVAALRRFVADAAHELQTPLTALRTNLELASGEDLQPDRQAAFLNGAQLQVERLNHLVRDLLDLSRLESGVASSQAALFELAAMARLVSEPYAAQAEQSGIELAVRFPADPVSVTAVETQLQHALGNLLDNALKFTPSGGVVTLSVALEEGWACLRVADTGIGIPPDDLPGLFERFHRGRNAAAYPGSGLGLAIVKAIAQSNGGRVSAENTPEGACFTLCLPVNQSL